MGAPFSKLDFKLLEKNIIVLQYLTSITKKHL
jgi:hypothetical protein